MVNFGAEGVGAVTVGIVTARKLVGEPAGAFASVEIVSLP